ncbi:hypothetical protein M9Y10_025956 [Tritrichomonas musculus]|uniref:Uncharacterized protein n=1 Tax=Tritrichomonas musculus TaxID=1915356 RepID=A0ABR2HAF4_9EUKA
MSGVGKDSDYGGGQALRFVDRALQFIGVDRDSDFMKKCHEIEHLRRAEIAEREGDHERAEAERKRAAANHTDKYSDSD